MCLRFFNSATSHRWVAVLLLNAVFIHCSHAHAPHDPRLQIGVNLFPAVLAANVQISNITQSAPIPVYVVYAEDQHLAGVVLELLSARSTVKGHPLDLDAISVEQLAASTPRKGGAILIAEPLDRELRALIEFSRQHKMLLFSPFKGDVKKGVMSGFDVTDKVLPAVNRSALDRASIRLKSFFMRIANQYE